MGGRSKTDKKSSSTGDQNDEDGDKQEYKLTGTTLADLNKVYHYLDTDTRKEAGLMLRVPVFIQDPLLALENPLLGVQVIWVRLEPGLGDGPTSARVAVVDFNGASQTLRLPVIWDKKAGWFYIPQEAGHPGVRLPDGKDIPNVDEKKKYPEKYLPACKEFIDAVVDNPYYHQLNVWAVVQRTLEFYEEPWALGRPVPWGFDGNRLLVVPHAGYDENAYYDQHSKSLQFYYYGDQADHGNTCLSHDIIAHETGHAILDGIRPLYNQLSSIQTGAFHEFIGDLTAILLALFNDDIRHLVAEQTAKNEQAPLLADIGEQLGKELDGRGYIRTAFSDKKMNDEEIKESLSPHLVSEVLTAAMYEILIKIAAKYLEKDSALREKLKTGTITPEQAGLPMDEVTPAKALWWAAERFRQVALQPLDLCPPADIQFLDYAQAVLRNDLLTNPVDRRGFRPLMLDVFHRRGLCDCTYQPEMADLPAACRFREVLQEINLDIRCFDIDSVSRSHTAAYYFLNENRKKLFIPPHQDFVIADLYETNKFGAAAERLPRELVIVYTWQEQVGLKDGENDLIFGEWNGRSVNMICGGTLVFDGRGNLKSWFHKPGTEHLTIAEEQDIRRRKDLLDANPQKPDKTVANRFTKQHAASLDSLLKGHARKQALCAYYASLIQQGLVGAPQAENSLQDILKPVTAIEERGLVRFETTPHLRWSDFESKEAGWAIDY
jgi:hypothetical protein